MKRGRIGDLVGIGLGLTVGLWAVLGPGCESIMPGLAEAKAIALDAQAASQRAEAAIERGDPAALEFAKAAEQKAENAVQAVAKVEAAAAEWATKVESGEITPDDAAKVGGDIGALIGGERGRVIGSLGLTVLVGWWYRRMARQIVAGIDNAKKEVPELRSAFRDSRTKDAVSEAVSPATWAFIEKHRV